VSSNSHLPSFPRSLSLRNIHLPILLFLPYFHIGPLLCRRCRGSGSQAKPQRTWSPQTRPLPTSASCCV
jgi:hypothetical protein